MDPKASLTAFVEHALAIARSEQLALERWSEQLRTAALGGPSETCADEAHVIRTGPVALLADLAAQIRAAQPGRCSRPPSPISLLALDESRRSQAGRSAGSMPESDSADLRAALAGAVANGRRCANLALLVLRSGAPGLTAECVAAHRALVAFLTRGSDVADWEQVILEKWAGQLQAAGRLADAGHCAAGAVRLRTGPAACLARLAHGVLDPVATTVPRAPGEDALSRLGEIEESQSARTIANVLRQESEDVWRMVAKAVANGEACAALGDEVRASCLGLEPAVASPSPCRRPWSVPTEWPAPGAVIAWEEDREGTGIGIGIGIGTDHGVGRELGCRRDREPALAAA